MAGYATGYHHDRGALLPRWMVEDSAVSVDAKLRPSAADIESEYEAYEYLTYACRHLFTSEWFFSPYHRKHGVGDVVVCPAGSCTEPLLEIRDNVAFRKSQCLKVELKSSSSPNGLNFDGANHKPFGEAATISDCVIFMKNENDPLVMAPPFRDNMKSRKYRMWALSFKSSEALDFLQLSAVRRVSTFQKHGVAEIAGIADLEGFLLELWRDRATQPVLVAQPRDENTHRTRAQTAKAAEAAAAQAAKDAADVAAAARRKRLLERFADRLKPAKEPRGTDSPPRNNSEPK